MNQPGLLVRLFDADTVAAPNIGRQGFIPSELGMNKALALISRYNRSLGSNWKAFDYHYNRDNLYRLEAYLAADFTIGCVDDTETRFEIVELLKAHKPKRLLQQGANYYYMDLGNTKDTGQFVLSTVIKIPQRKNAKYSVEGELPFITDIYGELLRESAKDEQQGPSCSVQEALSKQDLFVNPILTNHAGDYLWKLLREGETYYWGGAINLRTGTVNPLPIP